jgi:hypothetical protein
MKNKIQQQENYHTLNHNKLISLWYYLDRLIQHTDKNKIQLFFDYLQTKYASRLRLGLYFPIIWDNDQLDDLQHKAIEILKNGDNK